MKKNNCVEFCEFLVFYREIYGVFFNLSFSYLELKDVYCVDVNEEKSESGNWMIGS